ncbi:dethiobiotin synthase [Algivirga pacifica]|uniref:ATP-dependent dethiobiotin synthetase BioD n=1 Tax=Algivirga pacifica TaxID=1162670 RepID=A0ABP9DKE8_9BACT
MRIFVTAIHTDSGKTLCSAILTEALQADYWKPVQSGYPRDTESVKELVSNTTSTFYPEQYLLTEPMSPHASARIDGVTIDLDQITLPDANNLVVEGAGGLMVPLNDEEYIVDLIEKLQIPVILISNLYLGSINHSLLSINELKRRNIPVAGIIFNGDSNPESERIIEAHSGYPVLLRVPTLKEVTPETVKQYAAILAENLSELNK